MIHRHRLVMLATLASLLVAPTLVSAQGLDEAAKSLEDAAASLEDAAAAMDGAAEKMEAAADQVDGIEAPAQNADGAMYSCSKFERIVVNFKPEAKKIVGDKDTPLVFKASGHCNVVIRNVTLRGNVAIDVSGHANLLLTNVTIQGKKAAIEISGHANVRLRGSTIAGAKKAMIVSGHANVMLQNTTLKGSSTVSGFANVAYDKQSKTGKLKKSGKFANVRALKQ
jgi:exonuclease VII small subunit